MIGLVVIGTGSTMIVDANPHRQKLILVNNSDQDMFVAPHSAAFANQGVPLVALGGSIIDQPDAERYLYKGPWMGICASGGKVLSVTELNKR